MLRTLGCGALAALLAVGLAGCGGSSGRTVPGQSQGVTEVLQEQMGEDDAAEGADAPAKDAGAVSSDVTYADDQVDVDLTTMNADMVYATVNDMMINPSSYVGKVIRITGPYYHTYYEETQSDYFYVIIRDATACCAQGLEFVWGDGAHAYPDDYPADETNVVVTGVFETYTEGEHAYAHLVRSELVIDG